MLLTACLFTEFGTFAICHVLILCFGSILLQHITVCLLMTVPKYCLWRVKILIKTPVCEYVAYSFHIVILRPSCLIRTICKHGLFIFYHKCHFVQLFFRDCHIATCTLYMYTSRKLIGLSRNILTVCFLH